MSCSNKILITGAGPVGLTLAIMLAMQGIKCRIIDKRQWTSQALRAIFISKLTEKIFSSIKIMDSIMERALFVTSMSLNHYSYKPITFDYLDSKLTNKFYLHIYQPDIESVLLGRLEELNIKVERDCELVDLQNSEKCVEVKLNNANRIEESNYDYLIACDGVNSTVRRLAAIRCDEQVYNNSFFLADVLVSRIDKNPRTYWYVDETGYLAIIPGTNQKIRIIKSVDSNNNEVNLTPKLLEDLIIQKICGIKILNIEWQARSCFRHQIAHNGQQGRIFLAGDAYHIFSPIGGINMNFGLQDAEVLASILSGNKQLGEYEKQRRIEINRSLKFTKLLSKMMTRAAKYNRLWRFFFLNLENTPTFKKQLMSHFSGLSDSIY